MNGIKRNIESKISQLLQHFPVVSILGARQVGKTTLAKQLLPEWKYIDLENPADLERIQYDPNFFLEQYPQNLIIDEAQIYPDLFKLLRSHVDKNRHQKGRFLLTGSSSPELLSHIYESLAGRVAITHLGTLKANEFYNKPLSPLYKIFSQKVTKSLVKDLSPQMTNQQMQKLWFEGGYPDPLLNDDTLFKQQWMEYYRDTYINRDIASLFPRLNRFAFQRFLQMLSKLSGSIINKSDVARAIEVSEGSIREYMTIVDGTFLWRVLPSYEKNIVKSIIKMPKGHIRDSGLLHYMLKIPNLEELYENPIVGASFEGFVIEEIIKGLEATQATNWNAYYYRTRNGAEIDLILSGSFGTVPIEVKYGSTIKIKQLTSLIQFVKEHQLPFGIVINQSNSIEWLTPEVLQLPVGCI